MQEKISGDQENQTNQVVQKKKNPQQQEGQKKSAAYTGAHIATQQAPPRETPQGKLGAIGAKHRPIPSKQGKQAPHKAKQQVVQRKAALQAKLAESEGGFEEDNSTQQTYTRYPIKDGFRRGIKNTEYKIDFPAGVLVEVLDSNLGDGKVKVRVKRYGRYYVGKLTRDLIDWTKAKEFSPEEDLSEDFTTAGWKPANQMGLAYKDEGVFLRDKPLPEGGGSKKTGYLNQNDQVMILHQNTDTGWCFVSTPAGQLGYVAANHIWTKLPEPKVQVKKIRAGETALDIARNYYRGKFDRWGQDKRFLVNALVYANRHNNLNADQVNGNPTPGIYKKDAKGSWDETHTVEGQYIWLPSVAYLDTLKSKVGSDSYTYEAYETVANVLKGAYTFVAYQLGFVGGLVHGAVYNIYEKIADIAQSVVGVFQAFWKLIKGQLWQDLEQMGSAIYKIVSDPKQREAFLKELAQGLFGAILSKIAKLTSDNPWEAGHAAGYLTGYLAAEVLLAVFSGGAALLTRFAKLGKVGAMLGKVIGKAQDLAKKVPNPFHSRRRKKTGKKDRNDEKDENKLIQKQKALVMAKIITEGHDKADTPIPALLASLEAVKKKYPVVKGFYSKPKGKGHYEIWMRASDLEVDGDYSVINSLAAKVKAKLHLYPQVIDPRTGKSIKLPSVERAVPRANRVTWTTQDRAAFIREWHDKGYPRPKGGWDKYDIHHIHPREFGGTNDFLNLVPVERTTHRLFNSFWRQFGEL